MAIKNYITPQGYDRLMRELQHLTRVERPEVCQLVQWAASNGDRSENADYLYGKKRLREIDRRIRFLSQRLEAAVVVDPSQIQSTRIQFGATVRVCDEDGLEKTWTIVGQDEIHTERGLISWMSPIGKALLGKTLGEDATIQTPQGEVNLEIVEVIYQTIHLEDLK